MKSTPSNEYLTIGNYFATHLTELVTRETYK